MGARQSRRSVDITTTPKKDGEAVVAEGEGKLEKIGEVDVKVTSNGTAAHSDIEFAVSVVHFNYSLLLNSFWRFLFTTRTRLVIMRPSQHICRDFCLAVMVSVVALTFLELIISFMKRNNATAFHFINSSYNDRL